MTSFRFIRLVNLLAGAAIALAFNASSLAQGTQLGLGTQRPSGLPASGPAQGTAPSGSTQFALGAPPVLVEATAIRTEPANPRPGQATVVKFLIRNAGTSQVARVPWAIHLQSGNQTLASGEMPNVPPGASFEVAANWMPTAGTHHLQGYVDPSQKTIANTAHPSMRVKDVVVNVAHVPFAEGAHFRTEERNPPGGEGCDSKVLGEIVVNVPDEGFLIVRGNAALRGATVKKSCAPPPTWVDYLDGAVMFVAQRVFIGGYSPGGGGRARIQLIRPDLSGNNVLSSSDNEFDVDVMSYRRLDVAATIRVQRGPVRLRLEAFNGTTGGWGESDLSAIFLPYRQP